MNKKAKKWTLATVILMILAMLAIIALVAVVDPFFHYHKPLKSITYNVFDERYQNYGIAKNFDYDAIIVGTSMTENFKATQLDSLFSVNSVKTPFAGGTFKEVSDLLDVAIDNNPNLKMVVRSIDNNMLFNDKDLVSYSLDSYPTYLYDDNLLNDTKYVFNKSVVLNSIQNVLGVSEDGKLTTDFDAYGSWANDYPIGASWVNRNYNRAALTPADEQTPISDAELENLRASISQNYIKQIEANPDIDFYLFFPPYNIYYFDFYRMNGDLEKQLQAERVAVEMLVNYDNVHLYSFYTNYDLIWDISRYRDIGHYCSEINEEILVWMHDGVGRITPENCEAYCNEVYEYYTTLDYDAMYAQLSVLQ